MKWILGELNHARACRRAALMFPLFTLSLQAFAGVGFNAPVKYSVGGSPNLRVVADFNNDGRPDLAASDSSGDTVQVLMNNGNGSFTTASYTVGNQPTNVVSCDINNDGFRDLIVGNRGSNSFSVLMNQGGTSFAPPVHYAIGESPAFIACTANTANTTHTLRIITTAGNMKVYGDYVGPSPVMGVYTLITSAAVGVDPRWLLTCDHDADGDADPAVANFASNTLSSLKQVSSNAYVKTDYPVGAGPVFITCADFSGDNFLDLVTTNRTGNSVTVLINNGDATFKPPVTYPVGAAPGATVVADFNGDGKRDIAVRNVDSNSVSILINNGDGSFHPAVEIALGGSPVTITTGDFDADGKTDLVMGLSDGGGVVVLLGKGDGSFQAPLLIPVGDGPRSTIQVTDLNGDGRADIVVPLAGEGAIAVLLNSGATATASSGTFFSAPTGSGSGSSGISVAGGGSGCSFSNAAFVPTTGGASSPPEPPPVKEKFPHGLADFTTRGCTAGSTVTITVTYPQALPYGTRYWKFGPTASNTVPHWYTIPATVQGNKITFTISDGGLGDDDLTANGVIVDVGGPGWPDCSTLQGGLTCSLDADGDGTIDPAKDGVLILRRLMGFSGSALTDGLALSATACRSSATDIAAFIDAQDLDLDQSGGLNPKSALLDGLMLLRVMLGLRDTAVTQGLSSKPWATVRNHLNGACGVSPALLP
jgi:hypothetical protein